jgi:ADP-heptose:LPS heptosyltransferase
MEPMMAALKNAYPEARVTFLTFAENAPLAKLVPWIDDVHCVRFRKGIFYFLMDTLSNISSLRRETFDLILDCEFFSYYVAVLTHLVRRPSTITIGFFNNRSARNWMFTRLIAIDASEHISRLFSKMLQPLGIPANWRPLKDCDLRLSEEAIQRADEIIAEIKRNPDAPLIAVNVNTSDLCPSRRWPIDYFEQLIRTILEDPRTTGAHIILTGAKEDKPIVQSLEKRFAPDYVHSIAGRTTIEELAAILRRVNLFIGNDSGPFHLAMACGAPTLSFFGPETPNLYGPVGEGHTAFYARVHCSPCLNLFYSKEMTCSDNICLKAISPEEVFQAVLNSLRK